MGKSETQNKRDTGQALTDRVSFTPCISVYTNTSASGDYTTHSVRTLEEFKIALFCVSLEVSISTNLLEFMYPLSTTGQALS